MVKLKGRVTPKGSRYEDENRAVGKKAKKRRRKRERNLQLAAESPQLQATESENLKIEDSFEYLNLENIAHEPLIQHYHPYELSIDEALKISCQLIVDQKYLSETAKNSYVNIDFDRVVLIKHYVETNSSMHQCPICCGAPVCPVISRCSHVFCLRCLLRYHLWKHNGDVKMRSTCVCPVCSYKISLQHSIKPCFVVERQAIDVENSEDDIVFVRCGILQDLPSCSSMAQCQGMSDWNDDYGCMGVVTEDLLVQALDSIPSSFEFSIEELVTWQEKRSLVDKIKNMGDEITALFINRLLNSQELLHPIRFGLENYFYQTLNGQVIFIEPVFARIIMEGFGVPNYFTTTIESCRMVYLNENTMKKMPILRHLQKGQEVFFVEPKLENIPQVLKDKYAHGLESFQNRKAEREEISKRNLEWMKHVEKRQQDYRLMHTQSEMLASYGGMVAERHSVSLDDLPSLVDNKIVEEQERQYQEYLAEKNANKRELTAAELEDVLFDS
ncbi:hypothetical protein PCE1_003213 [Barthelona sp. PCE]